jgi:predicted AlkP superfamily phosphohydrolase/phosphomutase/tetratricopeptide (TPR) repeat protein
VKRKSFPRRFALPVIGLAVLAAAVYWLKPVRTLKPGEWLALPSGVVKARGLYPRWQVGSLHRAGDSFSFVSPPAKSRDGLEFSARLTVQLAPVRMLRLAPDSAAPDFSGRFTAQYLAPLTRGWAGKTGEQLLTAGPAADEAVLRAALERDGFTLGGLHLQILAPPGFAEAFGRKLVLERSRTQTAPILWVGLDAADWHIIRRLIGEGKLPNLRKLIQGGAWGKMRPFNPIISPMLWTTMVTGKSPAEHGINDFVVLMKDGQKKSIGSNYRTVKALWEIAPLAGRKVAFMDWWASFPAEPVEGGVIISNALRPLIRAPSIVTAKGIIYPPKYLAENLARLQGEYRANAADIHPLVPVTDAELAAAEASDQAGMAESQKEGNRLKGSSSLMVLRDVMSLTRGNTAEAKWLMGHLHPDLLAVYYESIDMMGHRFQHCMKPPLAICPPEDAARYGGAVDRYYEIQDAALGELLKAQQGPWYTLVVSDHGFFSGEDRPADKLPYTDKNPVAWHREEAVFILDGPGVKPGELPLSISIYDIMPTLLYLLGMPAADDFKGELAGAAFTPEYLSAHPVRHVGSYEELGPPHVAAEGAVNPEVEKELLANLARLGYVSPNQALPAGGSAPAADLGGEKLTDGAHFNKAKFLIGEGKNPEALEELNKIAPDKMKGRMLSLKVKVLDTLGQPKAAADLMRRALREKNGEEGMLVWLIQLDLKLGDAPAARRDVDELKSGGEASVVQAAEGLVLAAEGQGAKARAAFWSSLKADPTQSQAAESLFEGLTPREQPAFEALLREALKTHPGIGEYHYMLGALAQNSGRAAQAADELRLAVDAEPLEDRYTLAYAGALAASGRGGDAERLLDSQTGRHPKAAELWEMLGNLRGQRRDFAGAAAAFRKAREAGGDNPRLFAGLVATLAMSGDKDEARRVLADGLRSHPGDPALLGVQKQLEKKKKILGCGGGFCGVGQEQTVPITTVCVY